MLYDKKPHTKNYQVGTLPNTTPLVETSFLPDDVCILARDVTSTVKERGIAERERDKQLLHKHYALDLPQETIPSEDYSRLFTQILENTHWDLAKQATHLASKLYLDIWDGPLVSKYKVTPVFISLLRAGTPIGVIMRRAMFELYGLKVPHFSVSIIRGIGIDTVALDIIRKSIPNPMFIFIDGWIGKGRISEELTQAMLNYQKNLDGIIPWCLAVISDPVGCADYSATTQDVTIPTACLNSTGCGLVSRSVYDPEIGSADLHGAKYYSEFEKHDRTYEMIDAVTDDIQRVSFTLEDSPNPIGSFMPNTKVAKEAYPACVSELMLRYKLPSVDYVKPGIGETTRVLLRRVPDCVVVNSSLINPEEKIPHIYQLCKEKAIGIEYAPLRSYYCCGIVKHIVGESMRDV